jgi:hypothetical protein
MPRGKNVVNNKSGTSPQDDQPKQKSGKNDVCIPFLAGKCTFEKDCRKRHPSKAELPRLLARYKKTRCRFGDECFTEGCLFSHPREEKRHGAAFISPLNFPPLSNTSASVSGSSQDSHQKQVPIADSAWNKNPPNVTPDPTANRVSPSPSAHQLEDGSQQDAESNQHDQVPVQQPPTAWGYPNGPTSMIINGPPQPPPMPIPPPQGYFTGLPLQPIPPMMLPPNMGAPFIDPNMAYPIDPAAASYYHEQQQYFYQQQMGAPYPLMTADGIQGPMGSPFNAEAKEFVPGMSS